MTYEDSIRVLLRGTCGENAEEIRRESRLARPTIHRFVGGKAVERDAVDAIGLFVFRRMNAHLLLCDSDRSSS